MKGKNTSGYVLTILGGIFWALGGILGQYLFQNKGVTANWLVPIRLFSAGAIILIFMFIRKGKYIFSVWKNKYDVTSLLIFSIFGTMLIQYSYFSAVEYSNAPTATILSYLSPILIILFYSIKNKKMPAKAEIFAVTAAVLGTFVCATHGRIDSLAISKEALFWGVLSSFAFCIYNVQPQKLVARFDSITISGWGMLVGGTVLSLIIQPWNVPVEADAEVWMFMLGIVIFGTILAFCCYFEGVKRIGPTKGSVLSAVEPVTSAIVSVIWLKTPLEYMDIIGFVLILSTIFILGFDHKKN